MEDVDLARINPFSLARHKRYNELEECFMNGMDPDSKDSGGNTVLIVGAQNGNKRVCKIAMRYGCQMNNFNNYGNTALHYAVSYGYSELAEYLEEKGANPEVENVFGKKALEGFM